MARATGAWQPMDLVGIREDLTDKIYNIDPYETPFMSSIAKNSSAMQFKHEWQTDELESAADNAHLTGISVTHTKPTATTRLFNNCQNMQKYARVADEANMVKKAGRKDEMAYQVMKRMLELKTDMERALIGIHQKQVSEGSDTKPRLSSYATWIKENTNKGAGTGADPTSIGTTVPTAGTKRDLSEALVTDLVQQIWTNGGKVDCMLCTGKHKQQASKFTGNATKYREQETKKIVYSVDFYVSDFGSFQIVPSRYLKDTDVLMYQKDMWSLAFLGGANMRKKKLATTGTYENILIQTIFTIEAKNPKSSGIIRDLN